MFSGLKHYSLLSLISACFFFGLFHTVNAQTLPFIGITPTPAPSTTPTKATPTGTPIPTLVPTATATPTPTPLPTSTPTPTRIPIASPSELDAFFSKYSEEYHVDKELMKRIAKCESGFNSQSDTGTYAGMFQFAAQTWISARSRMGLDSNPDLRKNAEESIRTAAFMIGSGQQNAWANCL